MYGFDIIQDGMVVARVDSADRERAVAEAKHYALVYSEDGPVMMVPRMKKRKAKGK